MDSSSYVPSFSMALVQLTTMRGISDPVAMMYWSTSPPKSLGTSPGIELPYASTPTVTGGLQGGRGGVRGGGESEGGGRELGGREGHVPHQLNLHFLFLCWEQIWCMEKCTWCEEVERGGENCVRGDCVRV